MIIVTGGAGFIGSNLAKGLNERNHKDILIVDDLTDGKKFNNLVDVAISNYLDKDDFLSLITHKKFDDQKIEAIFHQGACSTTTEWNGKYMMQNNYEYSKVLLDFCLARKIPFIYASSAAVYGASKEFSVSVHCEKPLNVYGYSKLLFDQYVRRILPSAQSQIIGLRYFNVYGPREQHKGTMASTVFHFDQQIQETGVCKLFKGSGGYSDGEQHRDFIYVDDIVAVNYWFMKNPNQSGIFNLGTGNSQTFNDIAQAVIAWHQRGKISYIPFPDHLQNSYQSFTEANISGLRATGYDQPFKTVEEGVSDYLTKVNRK